MSASPADSIADPAQAGAEALDSLAHFTAETRFDDLPASIAAKAKVHLLDTLGAALAGTRSAEYRLVTSITTRGGAGAARLWGTGASASARDTALANGVAAHVFELDDTGGCDHSGAVVVPAIIAALSLAERPVSGRDLIASMVVGYDVGRRVLEAAGGYDSHNGAGWHSTGTCGAIGAAAAVANLLRLPVTGCRDAISLATSFASGLWAFIHDGTQAKKLHAGRAAEGGVLAAQLARGGIRGPSRVFDDVWGGFFRAFNHAPGDPAKLTAGLGRVWKLERVSLKPYASCRGTHSAIDALADMLAGAGHDAPAISSIGVRLSPFLMEMCGKTAVSGLAAAQMSLAYALAARLVFGDVSLAAFAAGRRRDQRLHEVMSKVTFSVDPSLLALDEPTLEIQLADGTTMLRRVDHASGSPQRPMPPAAVAGKFTMLATMAIAPDQAARLCDCVETIESLADCRRLEALLACDAPPADIFC